jgi:hypothetical protein
MRGRRPTFGNRDAQGQQRAVQVAAARKRRLAATQPPEPVASLVVDTPVGLDAVEPVQPLPVAVAGGSLPFVAGPPILPTTDEAVPLGWETDGSETLPPGRRFFSSGVQPPQPWQDQADTPLPLKVSEEQETAYHRGWREPPNLPPSDLDTAGASQPDPSATFVGEGAFSADATVVSPPEPVAGILAASVEPLGLSRIETDFANLLSLAICLEKMALDEIARLSNERPNHPRTIESNKKQSDLLSIFADGFAKLAAALEEYSKQPQPFFAGKAKEVVHEVAAQFNAWWKANGAQAIDWGIRLPVIIASTGLLGWAGADMTVGTTAVSALVGGPNVITAIKAAKKRTKRP